MGVGRRGVTALAVFAVATAAAALLTRPESPAPPQERLFGGATGVYGVADVGNGVAGFDVRGRDKVAWLKDIQHGRRHHEVTITDVRVAPVRFLELEVTLSRQRNYLEWPSQPTRRMVVKGWEQVWVVVRATGPQCPFGPPGTSFLAETSLTVDYESDGRRGTTRTDLDPMLVVVPEGVAC